MHPMGATLATECVGFLFFDLRSLLIETQAHIPSYGRWLEKTDMRGAYALHRLALQVLQSRLPTMRGRSRRRSTCGTSTRCSSSIPTRGSSGPTAIRPRS
jgi:hypothetical protein